MSTEAKKAEALSCAEMSGIAGGDGRGSSKGGGEFLVGKMSETLSEAEMSGVSGGASRGGNSGGAEFLVDPEKSKGIL